MVFLPFISPRKSRMSLLVGASTADRGSSRRRSSGSPRRALAKRILCWVPPLSHPYLFFSSSSALRPTASRTLSISPLSLIPLTEAASSRTSSPLTGRSRDMVSLWGT